MKKSTTLTLFLLVVMTLSSYGQLAPGYNTDGNTLILSTSPAGRLWGEFRVNTKSYNQAPWSYSDRGITQAYMLVTLFTAKNASLYSGAGVGVNLLSEGNDKWLSVNIPIGLKLNPFATLPELYLFGEYNPIIITVEGIPVIHSASIGFRYILSKKD